MTPRACAKMLFLNRANSLTASSFQMGRFDRPRDCAPFYPSPKLLCGSDLNPHVAVFILSAIVVCEKLQIEAVIVPKTLHGMPATQDHSLDVIDAEISDHMLARAPFAWSNCWVGQESILTSRILPHARVMSLAESLQPSAGFRAFGAPFGCPSVQ